MNSTTLQNELAWIQQYDSTAGEFADYIAASRYKSVYGTWPDGEPPPRPSVESLIADHRKWLFAQCQPTKWQKALADLPRAMRTDLPWVKTSKGFEAFPGQRVWQRKYTKRQTVDDARRQRQELRIEVAKLRLERDFLGTWFPAVRKVADDATWREQFLKLRLVESTLAMLESKLQQIGSRSRGGRGRRRGRVRTGGLKATGKAVTS